MDNLRPDARAAYNGKFYSNGCCDIDKKVAEPVCLAYQMKAMRKESSDIMCVYSYLRRWRVMVGLALVAIVTGMMGLAAGTPPIEVSVCDNPPLLDGNLDDSAWQQSVRVEHLYRWKIDEPAPETQIWLTRDDTWLYIGVNCHNADMHHVEQTIFEHGEPVFRDESIEILIDPGTEGKSTRHFMLSFANVKSEKLFGLKGANPRMSWNGPWRSVTSVRPDGWAAELAIPFYALESDHPDQAKINFIRNRIIPEIDNLGAKQGERRESDVLVQGNTKDVSNYAVLKGLSGFEPGIPFMPLIDRVEIGDFKEKAGGYVYSMTLSLSPVTEITGDAGIFILEEQDGKIMEHAGGVVRIDGAKEVVLDVPLENFKQRTISVVLRDEAGSLLAGKNVADSGNLVVVKDAFVGRSYYTSEANAELKISLGVPETMLARIRLRIEARDGTVLFEKEQPDAELVAAIPLVKLETGLNTVSLMVAEGGRDLYTSEHEIIKHPPRPGYEVKADLFRKVFLKDGEPFFPIGIDMIRLNLDEQHYRKMAEIGFNMLMPSGGSPLFLEGLQEGMELANKYDLQILFEGVPARVMTDTLPESRKNYEEHLPLFREHVKEVRKHRNLFMHFTGHEPNLGSAPEVRMKIMEWSWKDLQELDPRHPTLAVFSKYIPSSDHWTRWVDVLSDDIYIRPWTGSGLLSEPGLGSAFYANKIRMRCERDHKVMMMVPLAGQHSIGKGPIGNSNQQMLCQNYVFFIYGAKGLLFFCNTTVSNHDTWRGLKTICDQTKVLSPALLNYEVPQQVSYPGQKYEPLSAVFPQVLGRVFQYPDGDYLLLAANLREYAADVTVDFSGAERAVNEFAEKNTLNVDQGRFFEKLEPYGTRAYRVTGGIKEPVTVKISAEADKTVYAPSVDIPAIIRQMRLQGKNFCPNPCFEHQLIPGAPDFYRPYFNFTAQVVYNPGERGSAWFVDDQERWEGRPSLCLDRTAGDNTPAGAFAACYPPVSDQPMKMVFSFYAKGAENGTAFIVNGQSLAKVRPIFKLTDQWKRYSIPIEMKPAENVHNLGVRYLLLMCSVNNKAWISGLQLELGDEPTEFQDDSIIVKKK